MKNTKLGLLLGFWLYHNKCLFKAQQEKKNLNILQLLIYNVLKKI